MDRSPEEETDLIDFALDAEGRIMGIKKPKPEPKGPRLEIVTVGTKVKHRSSAHSDREWVPGYPIHCSICRKAASK